MENGVWDESNTATAYMGVEDVAVTDAYGHESGIILSWEAAAEGVVYQVFRLESGTSSWIHLENTGETSYKDTTAEIGVRYYYKVRAVKGGFIGNLSLVSATAVRPISAVEITTTKGHATGNIITWAPVESAGVYQVFRLSEDNSSWILLANTGGCAYKDETAQIGIRHYYKVRAVRGAALGTMQIPSVWCIRPPENVTLVEACAHESGIIVRWNPVEAASMYQVVRRTNGTPWTHLAYTTGVAYKDTTAEFGIEYSYSVRAIVNGTLSAGYDGVGVTARGFATIPNAILSVDGTTNAITTFGGYELSESMYEQVTAALSVIEQYGYQVGFLMVDTTTRQGITYQPDLRLYSASTIKGPYVASVAGMYPAAVSNDYATIKSILRYSDNASYVYLRNKYGPACMAAWCEAVSVDPTLANSNYTYISAREMALLWTQNYLFFSGSMLGEKVGAMFESPVKSPIRTILGKSYTTRSKAGWINGSSYYRAASDAGIVYAANGPYILAVMTDGRENLPVMYDLLETLEAVHNEMCQ